MPRTIPRFLRETADRLPNKVAIVGDGSSVTFSQLLHDARATAESLRELGIAPGDRVGVCMDKSLDQVSVILGVLFANAVLVPILPRLKQDNVEHIIDNSGMKALVTDSDRLNEVEGFQGKTHLIAGRGEVQTDWPNLAYMRRHLMARDFFDRIGADDAAIIYSSGSTGRPKGIQISHRNLADGADIVSEYLGTNEEDRIACILSFNFDYGLNQIWQCVRTGATLYLHNLTLPNDVFRLLADHAITALPVMPVIISQIFDSRLKIDVSGYDFSSLRYVCSTGGRLSPTMLENMTRAFPASKIYSMFGLTEAFRATYLDPAKLGTLPSSIGKAIPGVQILVLDENGDDCPPNVPGELVQRGATVTKGYWRNAEQTAKVFRAHPRYPGETLVFSGDTVMRDEEGYLYFVARADEMIKTRGFRVSPEEVESGMLKHEQIDAAMAFGIDNIKIGQDIACAYTTSSGERIPEKVLMQFLKDSLPRHMVPVYLVHFETFPITGNEGKFDRKAIKTATRNRLGLSEKLGVFDR